MPWVQISVPSSALPFGVRYQTTHLCGAGGLTKGLVCSGRYSTAPGVAAGADALARQSTKETVAAGYGGAVRPCHRTPQMSERFRSLAHDLQTVKFSFAVYAVLVA